MTLRFYNALTRSKQPFEPLEPGRVRIYSCGPTVYSHQHLGNMRAYVFADVLVRTLRDAGFAVRQVINITDVGHLTSDADTGDDKMERAAQRTGQSVWDIAEHFTKLFQIDIERLNVGAPEIWCRATDHIAEQIALIQALEKGGFTYAISDGVYFDTSRAPHYGELRPEGLEAQRSQERIEHAGEKRNPADFALWKLSGEGANRQMEWPSPWGTGFPGWHIECSAMSAKYLGVPFDIHTGGVDHIPVHHPNEIAQSEAGFGVRPCVRYWMHNGWLMFTGGKMSKSSGPVLKLEDLVQRGVEPLAFRYFLLGGQYRQELHFSEEALEGARNAYQRLVRRATELRAGSSSRGTALADEFRARFRAALADDLNTPQGLAVLWEAVRSEELGDVEKTALLADFDRVLGLDLGKQRASAEPELPEGAAALLREREAARKAKDFARSDALRAELRDSWGILVEDSPRGQSWRRA